METEIIVVEAQSQGFKFTIQDEWNSALIGRAYLYILSNDLHDQPFGFIEDVFIDDAYQGKGFGKRLMEEVVGFAKKRGCYKLVACSRKSRELVHKFYRGLGFKKHGFEFRMDL